MLDCTFREAKGIDKYVVWCITIKFATDPTRPPRRPLSAASGGSRIRSQELAGEHSAAAAAPTQTRKATKIIGSDGVRRLHGVMEALHDADFASPSSFFFLLLLLSCFLMLSFAVLGVELSLSCYIVHHHQILAGSNTIWDRNG
jgi:hypothetical protein